MNGFEKHGIKHLSNSSISLWEANPAQWVMSYLLKEKRQTGPAMWRGIVVEDICVEVLNNDFSFGEALSRALIKFDGSITLADEKTEKERAAIEPMAALALEQLKKYGKPQFSIDGSQQQVSITCKGDGWKIPIIGYLDLVYPDHGLVVDLKTTMRLPSTMMQSHKRQRCIYQRCLGGNQQVKFLYVTPKKSGWLEDGDVETELATVKAHCNRLERFLSVSDDPKYLASIVPVDPTHFYWSDCIDQRKELFGI